MKRLLLILVFALTASAERIAELHVTSYEIDDQYGDGCCWKVMLEQWHGVSGNIMYVEAQVNTPGVIVTSAHGPSGAAPPTFTPTSVHWNMPAPNGLFGAWQVVRLCFRNVPPGGSVTVTFTGYDSAGNTYPVLQQKSVTMELADWCDSLPDLWIRDTDTPDPIDTGVEPNTVSPAFYISQDIWVRNAPDTPTGNGNPSSATLPAYAAEHQHQNPIHVNAMTNNYIYVKVRNRGTAGSSGAVLRLYWVEATTGSSWPGNWNEIDCVPGSGGIDPCPVPQMQLGQDYVAEIPWVPPNPASFGGSQHFCLLARIEIYPWAPYGMTFPETNTLWQNVANNNNIAWKNVTVLGGQPTAGKVIVRNVLEAEAVVTLRFNVPAYEAKEPFTRHGTISIDLGRALMQKWRAGGARATGLQVTGRTTIRITDPLRAELAGLRFAPGEQQTMEVQMQLRKNAKLLPGRTFTFDVTQLAAQGKEGRAMPVGGERYVFRVP